MDVVAWSASGHLAMNTGDHIVVYALTTDELPRSDTVLVETHRASPLCDERLVQAVVDRSSWRLEPEAIAQRLRHSPYNELAPQFTSMAWSAPDTRGQCRLLAVTDRGGVAVYG